MSKSGAIIDALPHPLLVIEQDDRISGHNIAAEAFFQAGDAVLKRKPLNWFLTPDSPLLELIKRARDKGISANEYAVDLDIVHARMRDLVDIQVAPLAGSPGAVLVILLRRHMADVIDRQLSHRHAARSVSVMAAILAHEIKNPLSGIRGAAQLLDSSLEGDDKNLTKLIRDETDRIVRLIDRMDVSGDGGPVEREAVNIHEVLHHVREVALKGFASGLNIAEIYDPSLPRVPGSRDQLVQVFLNLVKNAAESVKNDGGTGEISLTTAFRPGMRLSVPGAREQINLPLEFCVRDTGPGVAPELLTSLFEPFVTTKVSGTGMGLALVARIIDEHGGVIECQSQPGDTVFRVLMPVYEGQPDA